MANKISKIEFKRDSNGNKCLSVQFAGFRAFSIQTNGNLPTAHKSTFLDVDASVLEKIQVEVLDYVAKHGTRNQKKAAGL